MKSRKKVASLVGVGLGVFFAAATPGAFGQKREPGVVPHAGHDAQARGGHPSPGQAGKARDFRSLTRRLRAEGLKVKVGGRVEQPFFSVRGRTLTAGGEQVQVFEYAQAKTADAEARGVDPKGSGVGTSMVSWIGPPHFYKSGRVIVLYVGSDQNVIKALESALGPQFAGK